MKRMKRAEYFTKCGRVDRLAPFVVDTGAKWKRVTPTWVYPTRCHERAYCFVLDNEAPSAPFLAERMRYVQGVYWPEGLPYPTPHSWVEISDDIIFDGVFQCFHQSAASSLDWP
jgi:hypothetical protein